ncbi:hypothetical protein ACK1W5_001849 [Salmonella enterica]
MPPQLLRLAGAESGACLQGVERVASVSLIPGDRERKSLRTFPQYMEQPCRCRQWLERLSGNHNSLPIYFCQAGDPQFLKFSVQLPDPDLRLIDLCRSGDAALFRRVAFVYLQADLNACIMAGLLP